MLFFCELYVIRDELALLGRTAHHPRSWASTSYNYNRSWASTSYNYNCLPATSRMVLEQRFRSSDESCLADGAPAHAQNTPSRSKQVSSARQRR